MAHDTKRTPPTIVISDVHGFPQLIQDALDDAEERGLYHPGFDQVVLAGDWLDRGADARECITLLLSLGAIILIGNHDYNVALGRRGAEQRRDSLQFTEQIRTAILAGEWKVAHAAHGVLVTHGGVSNAWAAHQGLEGMTAQEAADAINAEFLATFQALLAGAEYDRTSIVGSWGPVRLRPALIWEDGVWEGVPQVFGHNHHSTIASCLPDTAWTVSPDNYEWDPGHPPAAGTFRYAVIDATRVRVFDSSGAAHTHHHKKVDHE